jgi:hypothetical protein
MRDQTHFTASVCNISVRLLLWEGSRDSAVGSAAGYGLNGRRVAVLISFLRHPAGSEAHPASCPVGTGGIVAGT